jgi:hypothetical protein
MEDITWRGRPKSLLQWSDPNPNPTSFVFMLSVSRRLVAGCISSRRVFSSLNSVTDTDVAHFSKILSPTSVISTLPPVSASPDDLSIYNTDWMGKYRGKSSTVLKPKSTEEVSEIIKWCYDKRIPIVPQGGNTGLVGGSVPLKDEVILSLANMSKVRSFDPVSGHYFHRHIFSAIPYHLFIQASLLLTLVAFFNH